MAHHHKLDCLVQRLDCFVMVKVTEKVKNPSECSSRHYLLNCVTFCSQTWYGNASQSVVQEDWVADFKFKVTVGAPLIQPNMTVSTISTELLIFLQPNLIGWHTIISGSFLLLL